MCGLPLRVIGSMARAGFATSDPAPAAHAANQARRERLDTEGPSGVEGGPRQHKRPDSVGTGLRPVLLARTGRRPVPTQTRPSILPRRIDRPAPARTSPESARSAKVAPPSRPNPDENAGRGPRHLRSARRAVQHDLSVLALIRGKERFVYVYDDDSREELIEAIRAQAASPAVSLSWYDAAVLTERARQQALDAGAPPNSPTKG